MRKKVIPKFIRTFVRKILTWCARIHIVWPVVQAYRLLVREVKEEVPEDCSPEYTLLAISVHRFRDGELESLARTGRFRILYYPPDLVAKIQSFFWRNNYTRFEYRYPENGGEAEEDQKKVRAFMKPFLKSLLPKLGVDAVVSPGSVNERDLDWGEVSDELGYPYIVLRRENLITREKQIDGYRRFIYPDWVSEERRRPFKGTQILVHNEKIKEAFLHHGYANESQVSVVGCLRMDWYIKRLNREKEKKNEEAPGRNPQRVVFFSFDPGTGLYGWYNGVDRRVPEKWDPDIRNGLDDFFEDAHLAFAEFAKKNPGVQCVLKTKEKKSNSEVVDLLEHAFERVDLSLEDIPNLEVKGGEISQELILNSDVTIGFGSTVLLEAAIAKKPVIMPEFQEAAGRFSEYTHYRSEEDPKVFDIASSPEELKELISYRLKHPEIDESVMEQRRALFEKYISPMDGNVAYRFADIISELINKRRKSVQEEQASVSNSRAVKSSIKGR